MDAKNADGGLIYFPDRITVNVVRAKRWLCAAGVLTLGGQRHKMILLLVPRAFAGSGFSKWGTGNDGFGVAIKAVVPLVFVLPWVRLVSVGSHAVV